MSNIAAPPRFRSTCPHDCPSTCALEVEKLDDHTIGRVYGADNSYTQGVVCAKVARYAERIHHPERLSQPLKRSNRKSAYGEFEAIEWDDALDCVAERLLAIISEYGPEAVWPYHYAGTMGLVQRDGTCRCGLECWDRLKAWFRLTPDCRERSDSCLGWQPGEHTGQFNESHC